MQIASWSRGSQFYKQLTVWDAARGRTPGQAQCLRMGGLSPRGNPRGGKCKKMFMPHHDLRCGAGFDGQRNSISAGGGGCNAESSLGPAGNTPMARGISLPYGRPGRTAGRRFPKRYGRVAALCRSMLRFRRVNEFDAGCDSSSCPALGLRKETPVAFRISGLNSHWGGK